MDRKPITEFIHTKEVKESAINQSLTIYAELTAEDGYKQNHPFELSSNPPMSKCKLCDFIYVLM